MKKPEKGDRKGGDVTRGRGGKWKRQNKRKGIGREGKNKTRGWGRDKNQRKENGRKGKESEETRGWGVKGKI